MWRFWEGSENKNGNHEERTIIVKKISKIEIEQHKNHDGWFIEQTKQRYTYPISSSWLKDHRELETERQEDEGVANKTLEIVKIVDMDIQLVEEEM